MYSINNTYVSYGRGSRLSKNSVERRLLKTPILITGYGVTGVFVSSKFALTTVLGRLPIMFWLSVGR